jgi:hypothetical protein
MYYYFLINKQLFFIYFLLIQIRRFKQLYLIGGLITRKAIEGFPNRFISCPINQTELFYLFFSALCRAWFMAAQKVGTVRVLENGKYCLS